MSKNPYRKKTIVLADDEPGVLESLSSALHQAEFDVITAADGKEALDKILTAYQMGFPVDLLVTDIRMPVMNGVALIEHLEENGIFIPVLVLSGYGDKDLLIKLLRTGCRDYLDKPCASDEFIARLLKVLDKEEHSRQRVNHYLHQVEKDRALFRVETRLKNGVHGIRSRVISGFFGFDIEGELDDEAASNLRSMSEEAMSKGNINFIVNLSDVTYISSYGMGNIIYIWKRLKESHGTLYLLTGNSHIRRKIEELNLSRVIKVFDSERGFLEFMEQNQVVKVEE